MKENTCYNLAAMFIVSSKRLGMRNKTTLAVRLVIRVTRVDSPKTLKRGQVVVGSFLHCLENFTDAIMYPTI